MLKGVLLDLSGVLHVGGDVLPGAAEALAKLRAAGLSLRFVTNSTRRPKARLVTMLQDIGLEISANEVFTPAMAARDWLTEHGHSPHLLIHPDLAEDFANCTDRGSKAVVVGDAADGFTFDAMNAAFRQLMAGAPLLALAGNRMFMDADNQLSIDVGAFVRALEYAANTSSILLGKPAPAFFAMAAASMGLQLDQVAMVGDDAEADVAGALIAGVSVGILVRTGKYQSGDETRFDPTPSAVCDGIVEAVEYLLA